MENKHLVSILAVVTLLVILMAISGGVYGRKVKSNATYKQEREKFIEREQERWVGSKIKLNAREQLVNEIIMGLKRKEIDAGFKNPGSFAPARHFFHALKDIRNSEIFQIIQKMPKGAVLHAHDTSLVSTDYVLKNITYRENLYAMYNGTSLKLKFFDKPPSLEWKLLKSIREDSENIEEFDKNIRKHLTLYVDDPEQVYTDVNKVWSDFTNIFKFITPLLTYRPVWQDYFYQTLKEFYEDNVSYLEVRGTLPPVYELNGTEYGPLAVVGLYEETLNMFKRDHPDFLGARIIYAPKRNVEPIAMKSYVEIAVELKKKFPDFIAGFDMVGQEDKGLPLLDFIDELLEIPTDMKVFYHAAETNWFGSTDKNLIDAILLGTTRIGHGFGILKHPLVAKTIKEKGICIEVNPISNQVLLLVEDLRNHPASVFLADDYPVVISCDDPSFWEGKGLSYDMYMAFIGLANKDQDLRLLKQLALNSFIYSAMPDVEKERSIKAWNIKWDTFIEDVINRRYLCLTPSVNLLTI